MDTFHEFGVSIGVLLVFLLIAWVWLSIKIREQERYILEALSTRAEATPQELPEIDRRIRWLGLRVLLEQMRDLGLVWHMRKPAPNGDTVLMQYGITLKGQAHLRQLREIFAK